MANRRERQTNSAAKLRAIRQQLGWSMREVHAASVALAKKHRQPAFVIPPSRLHGIESKNKLPTIHRLYILTVIYRQNLNELRSLYGIPKPNPLTTEKDMDTFFLARRGAAKL
jgi:hypothetical protein